MAEIIDVIMRLTDNVTDRLRGIRSSMEQTARANRMLGNELTRASRSVGSLADSMMPLAAGIAGVGALGVKTFMDFDQVITGAAVKAGATADEMQQMKDAAAQMGAQFPTTSREVAEAMDRLAAGGFNASQTINAMPGIIEAAIASGEDLAATSDVITSALSIWNMTTGDVAANTIHIADVVQAAANASKLGMTDFGLAMQYAGAPAATLGISIEELGTAMGIMSNNGLQASTIGTSLRATLSRLAAPPKTAADALINLGLSVADLKKGDGSFIGLAAVVDLLRDRMSGLSDMEQIATAKAIAGEDAYSGLLALIKTSPEAYQQMSDAISNSAGSSHSAYMQMQDTLKGSVDAMMGSIEALGLSFGSMLAPTIRAAADAIGNFADAINNLSPAAKDMIIATAGGVLVFFGLTFAVSRVLSLYGLLLRTYADIGKVMAGQAIRNKALQVAVQGTARAFSMLRVAGLAMTGPMGLLVGGIALAAVLIYANWDKLAPFFQQLWSVIGGAFTYASNLIAPAIDKLSNVWNILVNAFQSGSGIFGVLNALSDVLAGALGGVLYGAIVLVSSVLVGVFTTAFNIVAAVVNSAIGIFTGLIEFITGVFTGDWRLAWQGVFDIFINIFGGVVNAAQGIVDGVKAAINTIIAGLNSISVDIPDWVPSYGGQHFGLNIPYLASGTDNWAGGPAIINERGEGEFVDLPKGTRVMPHDSSIRTAYRMGAASRGTGAITVNLYGTTINQDSDIRVLARKIAEQLQYEMEKEAINSTMGAI